MTRRTLNPFRWRPFRHAMWKLGIQVWWYDGALPSLRLWGLRLLPTKRQVAAFDAAREDAAEDP